MDFLELERKYSSLAERVRLKPFSRSWIYEAIRHYERNVPYDPPEDGDAPGRWDGEEFASVINAMPHFCRALRQAALVDEAGDAMQDFVDKCDRGEARSVRSYAKFSEVLARIAAAKAAGGE
jgi:hypothetical protein